MVAYGPVKIFEENKWMITCYFVTLFPEGALHQLRIDTHFADIHGFMNVALVGTIPWTAG